MYLRQHPPAPAKEDGPRLSLQEIIKLYTALKMRSPARGVSC